LTQDHTIEESMHRGLSRRSVLVGSGLAAIAAAIGIGPLDPLPAFGATYTNGNVPASQLSLISWTRTQGFNPNRTIRSDILPSLTAMNTAFQKAFGYNLPINDGYRNYAEQVQAKKDYGSEAATPGESPHGWATAIDVGTRDQRRISFNDATYNWLKANAGAYGCVHPAWAEPNGRLPEAWHWEFTGTITAPTTPEEAEHLMSNGESYTIYKRSGTGRYFAACAGRYVPIGSTLTAQTGLDGQRVIDLLIADGAKFRELSGADYDGLNVLYATVAEKTAV